MPPDTGLTMNPARAWSGLPPLTIPCNQCIGCRLDHARDWATRLTHEAKCHEQSCFVTLTYSESNIPPDRGIHKRDMQLWIKRLRKSLSVPIRYFLCGEYGDRTMRPHYHALIFGWMPPDLKPWRRSGSGHVLYRSSMVEETWPYGSVEIGRFSPQTAGYVARYTIKKVRGETAEEHYRYADPETGQIYDRTPPFILMSSKPGIGLGWFERFAGDAFPSDFLILDGRKVPVPRYYTKKLKEQNERMQTLVKARRMQNAHRHKANNTPERLEVREELQHLKAKRLIRSMEKDT